MRDPDVDPYLKKLSKTHPHMNFSSLSDLFGDEVAEVTIEHLATMKSGIPDYDTAIPDKHMDSLRAAVYAQPGRDYE